MMLGAVLKYKLLMWNMETVLIFISPGIFSGSNNFQTHFTDASVCSE
jgi:hypothetical protein